MSQFARCLKRAATLFIVMLANGRPAAAFNLKGHAAIERRAYELLRQRPHGQLILEELHQRKVLKEDAEHLEPHTTYPDLSFERQFAQDRQVYHFMAPNRPVVRAARLAADQATQQRQLLIEGVPDCLEMMYLFFQETLRNSAGASSAGRGIYVLMHAVADSYSHEHTSRDPATQQLLTVKGWRLARFAWPKAALAPEPVYPDSHTVTLAMVHRGNRAVADRDWGVASGPLAPNAEAAAGALADLLLTTYEAMKRNGRPPTDETDSLFAGFVQRHFQPLGSAAVGNKFVFPASLGGGSIQYLFRQEYNNQFRSKPHNESKQKYRDSKLDTFTFDRFPLRIWYAVAQAGSERGPGDRGLGAELSWHWTPGGADERGVILRRIPLGFALSATELPRSNRVLTADTGQPVTLAQALQVEVLFAPNLLSIPMVNATLQARVGLGALPFASNQRWAVVSGADLAWNLGPDFGTHYSHTLRLALGYAYDTSALPAYHTLSFKVGFNSWQGRVIKAPRK